MKNKKKSIFNWQFYLGMVLIVTGGVFLADQFLPYRIMNFFWPLLIVLFGLTFFLGMLTNGRSGAGLAIPGAIITTVGLLLFLQNTFDIWVTWSYAWALLVSATGLGILIMNLYLKRHGLRSVAGLLIGIGLTLFVVFGIFFEVILNLSGADLASGLFLGGGLVLLGMFVIFSRPLFKRAGKAVAESSDEPSETLDTTFKEAEPLPSPNSDVFQPLLEDVEFSGLYFKSLGEVFLTQGETCGLKIEGSDELLEKTTATVEDGVLSITYQSGIGDWTGLDWLKGKRPLRYFVTMKEIDKIDMAGAGTIQADNLHGESLTILHSGAGKLTLNGLDYQQLEVSLGGVGEIQAEGKVVSQNADLSGAGSYRADQLESQKASVSLSGAGSARVWAVAELDAKITGAGSIRYKGNPQLTESSTSLGEVKPL